MHLRRRLGAILLAAVLVSTACGTPEPTVIGALEGVGDLPGPLDSEQAPGRALTEIVRTDILASRPEVQMASLVQGPRVMAIGDSIFASAASRYGREICTALTPLGFDVEVNAEAGRFVDFGERVLDRRLRPGAGLDWDAFVISLGSNFGGDLSAYRTRLIRILDKVSPRPVLLFTVAEFRPDRVKLNDVIVEMVRLYPNVFVVDWSAIVAGDASLLQRDRLHLTAEGRERLAAEMARALGAYDRSRTGRCLPTEFRDDSAISGVEDASIVTPPPAGGTGSNGTGSNGNGSTGNGSDGDGSDTDGSDGTSDQSGEPPASGEGSSGAAPSAPDDAEEDDAAPSPAPAPSPSPAPAPSPAPSSTVPADS